MRQLEEKFNEEINEFNANWDNKLNTYKEEAKTQEDALREKHQKEMQDLLQQIEANNAKLIMKWSPQYIQLSAAEEKLVKQDK